MNFYDKYIELCGNLKDKPDRATPYKIDYLHKIIKDAKVYKFISFDGDEFLTRTKINTLKSKKIWFSFYKTLNDETEFQIKYNVKKISNKTNRSTDNIHLLVNFLTEMYDVYSLTYEYQDYMWRDYAANGNGICIQFNVGNFDYLYPVEYIVKSNIDFNKMIIAAINEGDVSLSIIPWVIKNPYNMTASIDSTREKEVRMLYCPYDNGEVNAGRLQMNIKERCGYKGIAKPYSEFGLNISKVIIGDKCDRKIGIEFEQYFQENEIPYEYLSCISEEKSDISSHNNINFDHN